jgi:hypothetical protein
MMLPSFCEKQGIDRVCERIILRWDTRIGMLGKICCTVMKREGRPKRLFT